MQKHIKSIILFKLYVKAYKIFITCFYQINCLYRKNHYFCFMINKRMKFPKYYKSQEGKYGSIDKMEKDFTIFYTSAPESYDGFGTKTVRLTEYSDRNGKPVREISIPKSSTDWQFNRNSSGNFSTMSKETFDELSKHPNGGFHIKEYSGQEIKDIFSKISSREGTDMAEFAENEINPNDTYILTSVSVDDLLAHDLDLKTFVDEAVEDYTPNKIIKEPILIGDSNGGMTKNVVRDGYSRVTQAKANGDKQIKAYVKKEAVKSHDFEDKEVVFHAMSKGGKDWFKITYDKKYNTFDKKSPTSMGGGYSESELHRIVKNELEYTPVVLIDKLKITSDTVKDEDYKNNFFAEKAENRSYSDKAELNEAFKNNSPADANILAKYHDILKDIIRLFNSGVVSASRYFGEKGIIDLSKKVGTAKTFKAARELFLKFTKEATETMKDYLLQADEPAVRLIGEPLYNELKEKYVGSSDIKPADTMKTVPTTNLMLYTKVNGDKTYKATDLKGNQVSNLAYASLINPSRYIEFIEAVRKTAMENPNTYFRVIETGNKKVWYDSEDKNTMKKEDRWQTIYGNNPDFAAVYSIGKSTKEVVVIKHKGKNYVIYADIAGVRREKDITHIGEAMEWLKGVLTKMSDVMGDKEVDESVIKDRLKLQYGKDLLEVNKTEMSKEKKYELGFGSMGNGTTVWNRAVKAGADYPTIAHISNEGVVNYYGKEYPAEVKKEIEDFAAKQKKPSVEKSVDAADAEVYIEYLNKDDRFKPMKKYFTSYSDAVKWGKEQFEKFDVDMVKYIDKSSKEPTEKAAPSTKDFEGSQESGTGKLYEYFTPMAVVEKMWALAYHYGKDVLPLHGMKVLDPAMGSGRLFTYAPKSAKVTGFEINKENEAVAMKYCVSRGFNRIQLYNESFEVAYLNPPRYNSKLKGKNPTWLDEYPFDLVVANPPYGKFTGLYKTHFNFNGQFEHFFIEYSMKLVKQNGLGIFVVPSSFLRNGNTYNSVKERIFNECKLVDAYRLPANIFKHTQIGTDIIVLQKK